MSLPSPLTSQIEKLISGGQGFFRHEGKAVFVSGVLPGETIAWVPRASYPGYIQGELTSILQPHPSRERPLCPHFGICGGCDFQFAPHSLQLEIKRQLVQESLKRIGGLEWTVPTPVSGSPWAYRNRFQVHCTETGVGLKKKHSDEILTLETCLVAAKGFQKLIDDPSVLPLGTKSRVSVYAQDDEYRAAVGEGPFEVVLNWDQQPFHFDLRGFFQSNLLLATLMRQEVLKMAGALSPLGVVWDLFAGAGFFGQVLARNAQKVVCVEENKAALSLARKNLPPGPHEFRAQTVEAWLKKQSYRGVDLILVDPPRTGLSPFVRKTLVAAKVPTLIYVSCNPDTLSRDLKDFTAGGWRINHLQPYDFFPQTFHTEVLVSLVREP